MRLTLTKKVKLFPPPPGLESLCRSLCADARDADSLKRLRVGAGRAVLPHIGRSVALKAVAEVRVGGGKSSFQPYRGGRQLELRYPERQASLLIGGRGSGVNERSR